MTTNYHTAITTGAPANASTVETPLASLDSAITQFRDGGNQFNQLSLNASTTLQISSGAVTITKSRHLIDTTGGVASTDNLSTISGGVEGDILMFSIVNAGRVVTVKHNTGNIYNTSEADIVLSDVNKSVIYQYNGSKWIQFYHPTFIKTPGQGAIGQTNQIVFPESAVSMANNIATVSMIPGFNTRKFFVVSSVNATFDQFGTIAPTPSGTLTASNDTDSSYTQAASAASSNAVAAAYDVTSTLVRRAYNPVFYTLIRTGSDITNVRFWVGLFSNGTIFTVDSLPTTSAITFRYSTAAGDAGWVGVCSNGTSQSVSGSIANIAASTAYLLKIRVDSANGIAYFSVNGGAEISINSNLPATTTDMGYAAGVTTLAAVTKAIKISRIYCDFS